MTNLGYILGIGLFALCHGQNKTKPPLERFVELKNSRGYDYSLPPLKQLGDPIITDIGLHITNMVDLKETTLDYTMDFFLRQWWVDYRLAYEDEMPNVSRISLPDKYFEDIWRPDTYTKNGKSESTHDVTEQNRVFLLEKNGRITYSQRLTVTAWCSVNLEYFPMDIQTCDLIIESYRYDTEQLVIRWTPDTDPVQIGSLSLVKFILDDTIVEDVTSDYEETGEYSSLRVAFTFRRSLGYFISQFYVPSCLLIIISWVSFWLHPEASGPRLSLGIIGILTMNDQFAHFASSSLPQVSYIKAYDVWVIVCNVFLFAVIMEFMIITTMARRPLDIQLRKQKDNSKTGLEQETQFEPTCYPNCYITCKQVDKICRVVFPVAFLIFLILYWAVHLSL